MDTREFQYFYVVHQTIGQEQYSSTFKMLLLSMGCPQECGVIVAVRIQKLPCICYSTLYGDLVEEVSFVEKALHNQRIERLWRDVFQSVLILYYELFYHYEEIQVLDPSNELDIFCLHFVYLPRINNHLSIWKDGWTRHKLSSERNQTPMQLYIRGLMENNITDILDRQPEREIEEVSNFLYSEPTVFINT